MKNNKGFTLVELIIVIAVMGALAGMLVSGFNYITYGNTKKCANRLLDVIDEVQMMDMTKGETTLLGIFKKGNAYYISKEKQTKEWNKMSVASAEKIAQSNITIQWENGSGNKLTLSEGTVLWIGFSKSSGAYLTDDWMYSKDIVITGRGSYTIRQIADTGKHYLLEE